MVQLDVRFPRPSRFALYSRRFRMFMTGSLISRVGDWMDLVALNWAVLQFTNSPLYLGLINGCRLVPAFLLSVPAGILADRYDRRKLLIWIQTGMMLLTFYLGYTVENRQSFWMFVVIVTLRSSLAAMDPPIRNALIPNLVSRNSMTSAIAINTTVIHLARIMGPALAGALLAVMNIADLFYINAWATLAVLLSLLMIGTTSKTISYNKKEEKPTVHAALKFIKKKPSLQSLLILAIVPMVFGFPYTTMMPLFARDLFQLGPEGFGMLLSISSIGALIGASFLSAGKEIQGAGKWLVCSIIGFGVSLLLFVGTNSVFVAGIAMFFVGLTSQTYRTLSRITLQIQVPDHLRGRILSIALMDRGFIPLGAILIGAVATWSGTLLAGMLMGIGCIAITVFVVSKRHEIWDL